MLPNRLFSLLITLFIISSCGNNTSTKAQSQKPQQGAGSASQESASMPPVESADKVTNYKPAFEGQTRISGVKTRAPYEVTVLSKELNKPWAVTALPDGRLIITEKQGNFRILSTSGKLSAKIGGIPAVNASAQGGLLDVVPDPDFKNNRMLYWTFSENVSGGTLTSVAKGKLSADESKIENPVVIYRATPAYDGNLHYGSRILFDRKGNLVISTGERSDRETRPQAQSLQSALGKIIRITTDGKPAAENPFLNRSDARPEFLSYGHRNPQGLDMHPETGEIWVSEMGPKGGDEINLIQAGKNYGWPVITYGVEYSGATIGKGVTKQEGMEQPIYYWDPVTSPSGMVFYSGDAIPEWKNNLFIGGLSSRHIMRIVLDGKRVTGEERLLEKEGQRFRDIGQGDDGALYAVTDEGRLYRISAKK